MRNRTLMNSRAEGRWKKRIWMVVLAVLVTSSALVVRADAQTPESLPDKQNSQEADVLKPEVIQRPELEVGVEPVVPLPRPVGGWTFAGMEGVDELMLDTLAEKNVPGAALAVVREGRLVAVRSYGWADVADRRPVTPRSRFRIASLSKPLTGAAILQLVERGHLSLDTKIFDLLELSKLCPDQASPADARWREITIEHLLRHRGGFDRGVSLDPMFHSVGIAKDLRRISPAGFTDITEWMLARPLDFTPGERYAYSNFGYLLLGRAIEKVTGQPYEIYMQQRVMRPTGADSFSLGRTLPDHRQAQEVSYYAPDEFGPPVLPNLLSHQTTPKAKVPGPYGAWCLETMDAHGGWIASVVDLAHFVAMFDHPEQFRVLGAKSIDLIDLRLEGDEGTATMDPTSPETAPREEYYGLGWMIRPLPDRHQTQWWHTGSLPGTAALMVRRGNGLSWVMLLNRRHGTDGKHLGQALEPLLAGKLEAIETWPDCDLFQLEELHGKHATTDDMAEQ